MVTKNLHIYLRNARTALNTNKKYGMRAIIFNIFYEKNKTYKTINIPLTQWSPNFQYHGPFWWFGWKLWTRLRKLKYYYVQVISTRKYYHPFCVPKIKYFSLNV